MADSRHRFAGKFSSETVIVGHSAGAAVIIVVLV
jgi:hypothetical protein